MQVCGCVIDWVPLLHCPASTSFSLPLMVSSSNLLSVCATDLRFATGEMQGQVWVRSFTGQGQVNLPYFAFDCAPGTTNSSSEGAYGAPARPECAPHGRMNDNYTCSCWDYTSYKGVRVRVLSVCESICESVHVCLGVRLRVPVCVCPIDETCPPPPSLLLPSCHRSTAASRAWTTAPAEACATPTTPRCATVSTR